MSDVRSVGLFDWVLHEGHTFQVVGVDGPVLSLRRHPDGRMSKVDVGDLLAGDGFGKVPAVQVTGLEGSAVLDTLNERERERVFFLRGHVHELVYGFMFPDGDEEPTVRSEFGLGTTMQTRLGLKVEELAALGRPVSRRSLERHVAAYKRDGVVGLVDGRARRAATGVGRVDPRLVEIVRARVAQESDRSTGRRSRLITESLVEFEDIHPDGRVPSRATMYRLVSALDSGHTFGDATARRSKARRPQRQFGRQTPSRPGQLVEIDSTPLDLIALYPDGSTGRVDLTVMLDVATRLPLATTLRPVSTKGVDAAVLLAHSLTPITARPGWQELVDMTRLLLPDGMVPADRAIEDAVKARPVIVPESITVDRGKVFVSSTFENACERLGVSIVKAAPHTPTDKPHIERFFGAAVTEFVQYLDGYTGISTAKRGKSPASDARWTLGELQVLLDVWLLLVWQFRRHSGLRHPAMPKRELSPVEMCAALAGVAPQAAMSLTRDDYISLLPLEFRKVQPYGVNFGGLHYKDDGGKLVGLVGRKSGLPAPNTDKYEVRYDPYALNTIWVRDPHAEEWIEAPWLLAPHAQAPFSIDVLNAAKKAITASTNGPTQAEILKQVLRIQSKPVNRKEERARNRAAKPLLSTIPQEEERNTTMEEKPETPEPASTATLDSSKKLTPLPKAGRVFDRHDGS